jgi:hypothetical protein
VGKREERVKGRGLKKSSEIFLDICFFFFQTRDYSQATIHPPFIPKGIKQKKNPMISARQRVLFILFFFGFLALERAQDVQSSSSRIGFP